MRQIGRILFSLLVFVQTASVHADSALVARKDVQTFMKEMINVHHFDKKQLTAILREAKFQPKIIESMDKPYEKKT